MKCKIRCRGLILHEGKLLVVKLSHAHDRYCLPGGKCNKGETLDDSMVRELVEELCVRSETAGIALIQELIFVGGDHNIEFFYWIKNASDYYGIDWTGASHAHELAEVRWIDIDKPDVDLYPKALCNWLKENKVGCEVGRIVSTAE